MNDAEREAAFMQRTYAEHLKFARRQAIIFFIVTNVMLISFVWIFFQREAGLRREAEFVKVAEELNLYKKRAEDAEQKILSQNTKLEEALKATEDCKSNK